MTIFKNMIHYNQSTENKSYTVKIMKLLIQKLVNLKDQTIESS